MPGIRGGVLWRPGGVVSVAGQCRLVVCDVSGPDWRLASIIKVLGSAGCGTRRLLSEVTILITMGLGAVVSRWREFEGVSVRRTALALPPPWRLGG